MALMRRARDEVARQFDVRLEPEIVLAGDLRERFEGSPAATLG